MPPTQPPLSQVLPPLIFGTATFNSQYNTDPFSMGTNAMITRAFELGIRAFDTSPYYGPSETLLGQALSQPSLLTTHPRSTYTLITKVGRLSAHSFNYTPSWIRRSITNSLSRLNTTYLDLVYTHDCEFVSPAEVLTAIKELRRIRDEEGTIKYVGISGYPVPVLCELAEMIFRETGEPVDAVMSYANYTLQNTTLLTGGLERLTRAGVDVVLNASLLGMGLLRSVGVPIGGGGDFHPAGKELRNVIAEAADVIENGEGVNVEGERLEVVSIRWALDSWSRVGASVGTSITPLTTPQEPLKSNDKIGVSVIGVSKVSELEETIRVWESVLDGLSTSFSTPFPGRRHPSEEEQLASLQRKKEVEAKAELVWGILGKWKDFAWDSPEKGFVNERVKEV